MTGYTIGIDQGTTQTTAVVVNELGVILAMNSVELSTFFPQTGRVEQDPWEILESVKATVRPLLKSFTTGSVGFDNQGETFVLWDRESGQPLTKAIVWQDKRGAAICERMGKQIDRSQLYQKTGLLLDSYFSAPKLRFLLENDPSLLRAVRNGEVLFGAEK